MTDPASAVSRDYRAFMTCTAQPGWLNQAQQQLGEWFREKNLDVELSEDGTFEAGKRKLRLRHHRDSHSRSLRAQLVEAATPWGTWSTDLILHERHGSDGWVSISVENDQGRFVDVPRLARYLMQTLPLGDGRVRFVDSAQVFRQDDTQRLVDLLGDRERHGLVFVAGTTDRDLPFESFVKRMDVWTKQVYGLGQVIVLDPRATIAFNSLVDPRYRAAAWGIRTFYPGVDTDSPLDWRRHRVLGPARLGSMEDTRVNRMLGTISRRHAGTREVPAELAKVTRKFTRLANSDLFAAIDVAAPAVVPEQTERPVDVGPDSLGDQLELVKNILQVRQLDEPTLRAIMLSVAQRKTDLRVLHETRKRVDEQQTHIENLEDRLKEAARVLDDDELERAQIYEDLERANAEIKWLRSNLQSSGEYDAAFGVLPGRWHEDYPESFSELLERIESLAQGNLRFTGDRNVAISVDENDTLQLAVRTAWDSCRALEGYLRAREDGKCDKGVDHYLRFTPSGYTGITPGKHAATETKTTMSSYGEERVFPVPLSVSSTGHTVMKAHFKLAQIGMVSPRMYYFDDSGGSGSVYIGYIGPHLTNTQTN